MFAQLLERRRNHFKVPSLSSYLLSVGGGVEEGQSLGPQTIPAKLGGGFGIRRRSQNLSYKEPQNSRETEWV